MPLRGELDSVDLAHVFQMLVLNEKAGTLEIVHEGAKRHLYFGPGGVQIRCDRSLVEERVVRGLVRVGRLNPKDLEKARCNASMSRKEILDTLVEMGLLDANDREHAMKAEHEEEVYELFFLRGATFEFRDKETPQGLPEPPIVLSAHGLVIEAARRVDEWSYIQQHVHSGTDIFERACDLSKFDERERTPELESVQAALDGVSTVDEVIATTGICRFLVFRQIALLSERGAASLVPANVLVERSVQLVAADRLISAANCLERAIEDGIKSIEVYTRLGQCLESLGRISRAAQRYFDAAQIAERDEKFDSAIALYLRVRELLPTRIDARLRLFAMRERVQRCAPASVYDTEVEGKELTRVLHELGRRGDVQAVLAGLMEFAGDEPARLERVGDLAGMVGQRAVAVESLLRASDRRQKQGDLAGALHTLRRAQTLEPSREELTARVRSLQSVLFDRRDRRRSTMRALAMALGFCLLFVVYGQYSKAALDAYGQYSIEDFIAAKDFERGKDHYESIRGRYPLTIPFLLAGEKIRELEIHERHNAEIEDYRRQVQGEQAATNLKQAKSLRDAALEARHSGDYRKSLDLLRRAKTYCGGKDPLELVDAIKSLEDYLAQAARLRSEAQFFRNAGRFEEAHDRLVELLQKYKNAPDLDDILLPVKFETKPDGARIRIEGKALRSGEGATSVEAETPFVVDLPADRSVDVELVHDGFVPYTLRLDARDTGRLAVTLPQRPSLEAFLPRAVAQPFVSDGSDLYVALENGRISSLNAATLEVKWTRELPELAEIAAPLAIDEKSLFVPASPHQIVRLSRKDGSAFQRIDLPDRPASAPVLLEGRIAVRCVGGRLALGSVDSNVLEVVNLPSPAILGPLLLPGSRLAVVCEDGRVWVRSFDGTLSALRGSELPIGRVTAMAADDTTLWLGDDTGSLFVFDAGDQAYRCSLRVFDGAPIDRISPDRELPAVGAGNRIAVVDCRSNRVSDAIDDGAALAESSGKYLAAIAIDGTVRILERGHLKTIASFACGEKLLPVGALKGEQGWFAAAGGRVLGVRVPD